jgi:NADP-dependent 3-hydroxy acid dehydrogenase YdfG
MPQIRLKPLSQQTIVITGASSGIGLATARRAVRAGARVFLISRNEAALKTIAEELRARGGRADFAVADVGDRAALEAAAEKAQQAFGGFDSWVNDAGVSIYGELEKTALEDQKRLFDTNYWGVVHGSLIAAKALRGRGGAIVNIGSVLSDRAMILQGTYSATKHAVRGFTDTLRMELERDGRPISVTLIKPSGIETGFQDHARSCMPASTASGRSWSASAAMRSR